MSIKLKGSTDGSVTLQAPADTSPTGTDKTLTLPTTEGSANQFVKNGSSAGSLEYSSMVEDSDGRLLVGTSSDISGSTTRKLQVVGADEPGIIAMGRNDQSISSGNTLGKLEWYGNEGSTYHEIANISIRAEGNHSSTSKPTNMRFFTTASSATTSTERLRLSAAGEVSAQGIYDTTSSGAANVYIHPTNYILHRSTSSIKYKTNVETLEDQYADALLGCRPVWYQSKCNNDNPDWGHWGFIAEEVAEIDPRLVSWKTHETSRDENGELTQTPLETPEPEGVQYDRFVPHLLNLIKRQQAAIETLEAKVAALEAVE